MSDTAPFKSFWKPSRTKRKLREKKTRKARVKHERDAKAEVRRRDKFCRFPLCGCRRAQLAVEARTEVSHARHKGMGGNPAGDRSTAGQMVLLCLHRHQYGIVSRHAGTLRARYLTRRGFDGPIAWEAHRQTLRHLKLLSGARPQEWIELAREAAVGVFEPFEDWQLVVLKRLGEMVVELDR